MGPAVGQRLQWGIAVAFVAMIVIAILAFVPDPFFRQRVVTTRFDDVESLDPGVGVFFRGAEIGTVRRVALDPETRLFDVDLGIARSWRPSRCSFARIGEPNPFTTPRVEIVALETDAASCSAARVAVACDGLPVSGEVRNTIEGCRRGPGLFAAAAIAVEQAAAVARTANQMATRLADMLGGSGGPGFDTARLAQDSTATLAALSAMSQRLNAGLDPKRGDIALTLANVRRATGRAGDFDMATLNGTMREVQSLVAQNQANIAGMLSEGRETTAQSRALLESISASLTTTSANLARASDGIGTLTERLAADPTFALHGSRFADPPAPEPTP